VYYLTDVIKHYPYGYLFCENQKVNVPEYFSKINILENYSYYFDPHLDIKIIQENNRFIIIHGQVYHVGIDEELEINILKSKLFEYYFTDYQEFLDLLDFLAGRFVIIIGNSDEIRIFPDATHSRSTYFIKDTYSVSSHVNLLKDSFKLKKADIVKGMHNTLIQTPYENVYSILSNHSLTLKTNHFKRFFPRSNNGYTDLSEDRKFELIERFWQRQLDKIYEMTSNVFLTLTGGGDSRTSLALLKKQIKNTVLVTYAYTDGFDDSTPTGSTLSVDNTIVKQIINEFKLNHKFLYFDQEDKELTPQENLAISKNSIARHSSFFVAFLRSNFDINNLTHIRANLLEIGQAYPYKNSYKENTLDSALEWFLKRHKAYLKTDADYQEAKRMFNEYTNITNFGEGLYDYHILDIYYWEIQMGRWYPELLNTHDIVCNTITPYNHRALIDITLSFNYKKRKNRYFQYELINRNFPILNFFGLNNTKNIYEQQRDLFYETNKKNPINNFFSLQNLGSKNRTQITPYEYEEANVILIPDFHLELNSFSEVEFKFKKNEGILSLGLKSLGSSNKSKNVIFYEIYINEEMKLYEDMSNWKLNNSISIAGLKKGDIVKIRVSINKYFDRELLRVDDTKLLLTSYNEISSKKGSKSGYINASSPYSNFE